MAFVEIMIPLISTETELKILRTLVDRTSKKTEIKHKIKLDYMVGTMIELPRAALQAETISRYADFFSFGTNDLTQTTLGISRDDSSKFLNNYINNKIFEVDPFVSIDQDGVGELLKIATKRGRKINKKLKLGICGEHGGDPKSIQFCSNIGLNYISCSPFRVPVARLAAAQAELKKFTKNN
jgi:pyruvate,orthophosphate dikinase